MFFVSYFSDSSGPSGSLSHLLFIQFISATPDHIILEIAGFFLWCKKQLSVKKLLSVRSQENIFSHSAELNCGVDCGMLWWLSKAYRN